MVTLWDSFSAETLWLGDTATCPQDFLKQEINPSGKGQLFLRWRNFFCYHAPQGVNTACPTPFGWLVYFFLFWKDFSSKELSYGLWSLHLVPNLISYAQFFCLICGSYVWIFVNINFWIFVNVYFSFTVYLSHMGALVVVIQEIHFLHSYTSSSAAFLCTVLLSGGCLTFMVAAASYRLLFTLYTFIFIDLI